MNCTPLRGILALRVLRSVSLRASVEDYLALAEAHDIDLTVVGPEAPLVAGVVDRFRAAGRAIFGPTAAAAQLEGSKSFSKDFMVRAGIPTARYTIATNIQEARAAIQDSVFLWC